MAVTVVIVSFYVPTQKRTAYREKLTIYSYFGIYGIFKAKFISVPYFIALWLSPK
jgi:hypothetical protein